MQLVEDSSVVGVQSHTSERLKRVRWDFYTAGLRFGRPAKRAFDILVATAGLAVFSPLFLLSAIAIKIETRGPVFGRQVGLTYGNESIRPLRFRTTGTNLGHGRVSSASLRLTRVGSLLRFSGIEGLPQLVNVLRGEMSLVGPQLQTMPPSQLLQERLSQISRRKVKPGIIGWAELNRRRDDGVSSSRTIQQQIQDDLYYVENWSFLFDLKIVLMTLFSKATYEYRADR